MQGGLAAPHPRPPLPHRGEGGQEGRGSRVSERRGERTRNPKGMRYAPAGMTRSEDDASIRSDRARLAVSRSLTAPFARPFSRDTSGSPSPLGGRGGLGGEGRQLPP